MKRNVDNGGGRKTSDGWIPEAKKRIKTGKGIGNRNTENKK